MLALAVALELGAVEAEREAEVVMRDDDDEVWVGEVVALDTERVTVPESVLTDIGLSLLVRDEGRRLTMSSLLRVSRRSRSCRSAYEP